MLLVLCHCKETHVNDLNDIMTEAREVINFKCGDSLQNR